VGLTASAYSDEADIRLRQDKFVQIFLQGRHIALFRHDQILAAWGIFVLEHEAVHFDYVVYPSEFPSCFLAEMLAVFHGFSPLMVRAVAKHDFAQRIMRRTVRAMAYT
jgi:hypothetical protein